MRFLRRLVHWLGMLFGPGGGTHDPFADKLAPVRPRGTGPRTSAVAVAEPEDQ